MDAIDAKITRLLCENAQRTAAELASEVNLSVPAVNKRIARLKESGVIRSVVALTDPDKVAKPIIAYVLVVIDHVENASALTNYIDADDDVLECSAVTGEYDYLLKICASDIRALESKLLHLKRRCSVVKSHTMLALMEHKFAPAARPDERATEKESSR